MTAPVPLLDHGGHGGLGQKVHAPDIHIIERVELFGRHLQKWLVHGDAGVVYQHVKPAQEFDRLRCQRPHLFDVGQVRLESLGRAAGASDLVNRAGGPGLAVGVVQHDGGALAGELQGNAAPDAGPGAGHEYALALHSPRMGHLLFPLVRGWRIFTVDCR